MMNRLANCHNEFQGDWKKVLCVCSAGLLRSPTIAWVLSNPPWNCNTRACGTDAEYALIPMDKVLLEWADEIVCASGSHMQDVKEMLKQCEKKDKPIYNLGLPDIYRTRETRLVQLIQEGLDRVKFTGTTT